MGFKLNRTYRIKFEGGMEGAEIVFKTTSVSTVLQLREENEPAAMAALLEDALRCWIGRGT